MKKAFTALIALLAIANTPRSANAETPLKIVTTLSTYADIAQTIGGEQVEVKSVASPKFDPHYIEPRPSDILRLKRADLFIHSGLDLEAWRDALVDAAAVKDIRRGGEKELNLSRRISLLEVPDTPTSRSEGDIHLYGNPHYWLDPRNGMIIAEDIARKLSEIDPNHSAFYQQRLHQFSHELQQKIEIWLRLLEPYKGERIVGYHNGWPYLMNFAGLKMEVFLEPKPGIPPTPRQLEQVIDYISRFKVKVILQASHNPTEAALKVAQKTTAKVIILAQAVDEFEEVSSYLKMLDYNIQQILGALKDD